MSSTYFTLTPYFFSNWSSVGCDFVFSLTSMYSGQFEKVIVFGRVCATVLAAVEVALLPPPPQAASRPGRVRALPVTAERRRKSARVKRELVTVPPGRRRRRCNRGSTSG